MATLQPSAADALRDDVLIAYEMNGQPLLPQHGHPARLLVPGWYGMASVKWLQSIKVVTAPTEEEEARYVATEISRLLAGGIPADEIAILYRSNAQSRVFEEVFLSARIPYKVYGGLRFFERQEIKDALAYLRLISNRDDDASFERVVNLPTRGIGARTLEVLRAHSREHVKSMWAAAFECNEDLGSKAVSNVAFRSASGYLTLPAGKYDVRINVANSNTVVLSQSDDGGKTMRRIGEKHKPQKHKKHKKHGKHKH